MELSARYVYQIYQKKSFSAAAKELYVSQPALSASVARLETELGFRIFDRSTVPLSLTPAGRIYIESLEEIMESERHMRRRLRQLSDISATSLSIGGSSYSAYYLLPAICRAFTARYPDIRLRLNTKDGNLRDELNQQTLDLILSSVYDPQTHQAVPLINERLIVAMHKDLLNNDALRPYALRAEEVLSGTYPPERELADFSLLRGIPFFRFRRGSLTYHQMAKILGDYAATPHTISNAPNRGIYYGMMCAGLGALLTSDVHIAISPMSSDDLLFFMPKCPESHRTLYMITKQNLPDSHPAHRFIRVATELAESGKLLSLHRFQRQ